MEKKLPLGQCLTVRDFEAVAQSTMRKEAWEYYSTGAEDEFVGVLITVRAGYHRAHQGTRH